MPLEIIERSILRGDDNLCRFCCERILDAEYGSHMSYHTLCEGRWCQEAEEKHMEDDYGNIEYEVIYRAPLWVDIYSSLLDQRLKLFALKQKFGEYPVCRELLEYTKMQIENVNKQLAELKKV